MGYRLKSDIAVNDPNNLFDMVFTDYGIATKSMQLYLNNLSSSGYELSIGQFNSLSKFENTLKNNGIWENIIEIIPLLGNNIESMRVKYKGKNSLIMNLLGGIDNSNVEPNKGINNSTESPTSAKGFNTLLKKADLTNGLGVTYFGRVHGSSVGYPHTAFGISNGTLKIRNSFDLARSAFQDFYQASIIQANVVPSGQEFRLTSSVTVHEGKAVDRRIYNSTELKIRSTSVVNLTPFSENGDLYLGCENHITNGAINGFYGRLRLCIVNDGNIPTDNMITYIQACEDLFTELGKDLY